MSLQVAEVIATLFETYVLVGLFFALLYLPRGAARLDPHLAGSSILVRLLIVPGIAALWPLMASRWLGGGQAPIERNAHREAAVRRRPSEDTR